MSLVLIVYLVTVAVAFPLLIAAGWDDDFDSQMCAVLMAGMLCGLGPFVLLAFGGIAIAEYEPRHVRQARRAAEVAEFEMREVAAIAERERALGLRP